MINQSETWICGVQMSVELYVGGIVHELKPKNMGVWLRRLEKT